MRRTRLDVALEALAVGLLKAGMYAGHLGAMGVATFAKWVRPRAEGG